MALLQFIFIFYNYIFGLIHKICIYDNYYFWGLDSHPIHVTHWYLFRSYSPNVSQNWKTLFLVLPKKSTYVPTEVTNHSSERGSTAHFFHMFLTNCSVHKMYLLQTAVGICRRMPEGFLCYESLLLDRGAGICR